jgi:hypothetical protein
VISAFFAGVSGGGSPGARGVFDGATTAIDRPAA